MYNIDFSAVWHIFDTFSMNILAVSVTLWEVFVLGVLDPEYEGNLDVNQTILKSSKKISEIAK